jgi:hypothetical protein
MDSHDTGGRCDGWPVWFIAAMVKGMTAMLSDPREALVQQASRTRQWILGQEGP